MKIPFSISDRSLTFYVEGQPYSVDRSAPAYPELRDMIQTEDPDIAKLISLTNPVEAIRSAVLEAEADYLPRGLISVTRSSVTYNGTPLHGVIVDRIFDLMSEGFNIQPMVRFLENLMTNPTDFARDEMYLWLETSDLPITEDGHFLAYKSVRSDFKSHHGGVVDNTPGTIVEMPRQEVDKDRNNTCSTGLHFCSKSYLSSAYNLNDGVIVLLKINPADVVSIPSDYGNSKGRAWKYEVLHTVEFDIDREWAAVYTAIDEATDEELGFDAEDDELVETAEDEEPTLVFPSDLASALYAALNDIGISTKEVSREARLGWANWTLYALVDDFYTDDFVESFKDLTIEQAGVLLEAARGTKAEQDFEAEAADTAEQARLDAINSSYGSWW